MKKDLQVKAPFIKGEVRHTNKMKLRVREGYVQIWIDNKPAAYAGIRFTKDQISELTELVTFLTDARDFLKDK